MTIKTPSRLLPLPRTRVQGAIQAWVFLHPETAFSISEIARHAGVDRLASQREVDSLAAAGLLSEHWRGRSRMVRPNLDNPVVRPLSEALAVAYGPVPVVAEELDGIDGIEEAHIFGSWADRYLGRPGRSPADVDVLVVGTADQDDLWDAGRRASNRVGREVNVTRVRPDEWRHDATSFIRTVKGRPMVTLIGAPNAE
ncbi:MAG: hypothetical protein LBK95_13605 [Bifidobacteriaceae bacterium]|nr:hypothetical protein [Bifidobacteriaceae bacterium]